MFQKLTKIDAFQATEKQQFNGKRKQIAKKRFRKLKHIDVAAILEAILVSSWGTWEAFGGHVGRLWTNLSQHKAILSHLGANLKPPQANLTST